MAYGTLLTDTIKSSISGPVAFQNTSGTEVGTLCRAWVNFNGTGTVAIRSSFNVSSITDNGTGDYTVNFTTALSDANYAVVGSCAQSGSGGRWMQVSSAAAQTTTAYRVTTYNNSNVAADLEYVQTAVFR